MEKVTTGDINTTSWFWAFLRCIETLTVINHDETITDTFCISQSCHESAYYGKIRCFVIIFEHRHIFRALISARLLELSKKIAIIYCL